MGKPYNSEILNLDKTYSWALDFDVKAMARLLRLNAYNPSISVGSGGSYSAAELQATLQKIFLNNISMAVTPTELVSTLSKRSDVSVWFLSAGGSNIDIYRACKHALLNEVKSVNILVGRKNSKLSNLQNKYHYGNIVEAQLPCGKDGFLATNSLLAFSVIFFRAYCYVANKKTHLPKTISSLLRATLKDFKTIEKLRFSLKGMWEMDCLHVIYSNKLKSVAVDIESKFIEAGLGSIHIADVRNFAHGRHQWFSKNFHKNGILCLSTEEDKALSIKTLSLLPDSIQKESIIFRDLYGAELIAGILLSIYFSGFRGEYKNIDPGRPGVPGYGSKIYRLTGGSGFSSGINKKEVAIKRKLRMVPGNKKTEELYAEAYETFKAKINKSRFAGVVFDYDGTLVDARKKNDPPTQNIVDKINNLLQNGILVAFATGRGKSIREALTKKYVINKKYWDDVLVGYYNGSEIARLSDEKAPSIKHDEDSKLYCLYNAVKNNEVLKQLKLNYTLRGKQLTIEPLESTPETFLYDLLSNIVSTGFYEGLKVVRSSHSVDVISSETSKLSVVSELKKQLKDGSKILTVGDRGRWPGNDYALLSTDCSLSVDEVSEKIDSCWNLCPAGVKGVQGVAYLLGKMKCENGLISFKSL